jgi:hypothetical protein
MIGNMLGQYRVKSKLDEDGIRGPTRLTMSAWTAQWRSRFCRLVGKTYNRRPQ